jgi:hypothetical protein
VEDEIGGCCVAEIEAVDVAAKCYFAKIESVQEAVEYRFARIQVHLKLNPESCSLASVCGLKEFEPYKAKDSRKSGSCHYVLSHSLFREFQFFLSISKSCSFLWELPDIVERIVFLCSYGCGVIPEFESNDNVED